MLSLEIAVICTAKRRGFQEEQMAALALPWPVRLVDACTPEDSAEYCESMLSNPPRELRDYPHRASVMCCTRSHTREWRRYANAVAAGTAADFLLVIEDDVSLLQQGFAEALAEVIQVWERNSHKVDVLQVGYLPRQPMHEMQMKRERKDGPLRWDLRQHAWGTQAYLVPRRKAEFLAQMNADTCLETYQRGRALIAKRYGMVVPVSPESDFLLTHTCRQGIVEPMLAIEYPFESLLEHGEHFNGWSPAVRRGEVDPSK